MPTMHVSKSIQINAPFERVYECVRDLRQWPKWSPRLITDPGCQLTYADDGRQYAWDGKVAGSGKMTIVSEDKPHAIEFRLEFFSPQKNQADGSFSMVEKDGGVEATWSMTSSLPIFLFFLRPMMTAFIGMDYSRGLAMLKDSLETGAIPSRLEFFDAPQDITSRSYVGIRTPCTMANLGPAMEHDMARLKGWLDENPGIRPSGVFFSQYHKWDAVKGMTEYTLCVPLEEIPKNLPEEFLSGVLPACKTFAIKHTGAYRHLGNAWSAGFHRARGKVIQQDRKIAPFETYENDPRDVDEKDLVTIVHFPLK